MDYDFDEIIDRQNTDSVKYDLRKAVFGRGDVLPMWVADMDFRTPDFIIDAIKSRLNHEVLGYALKPSGLDEAIVNWVQQRHGWNIHKGWIVISPGVVPSMAILVQAFTDPGDEVIVQQPVYFPFFKTIRNNGRKILNNPLVSRNGQYEMDLEDLKTKITARTRMIFLCSPHNPGGRVWKKRELEAIAEICIQNNILIISDEIHADLILFENRHIPTATLGHEIAQNTITCMSSSKTFNTAGLNTSYLIISNHNLRRAYKEKLSDFQLDLGNIAGLTALEASYLKGADWLNQLIKYLEGNILFLETFIQKNMPSIQVMRPEGTYLVWLDFRKTHLDRKKLNQFLIHEAGLGLSDGALFGGEGIGFQRLNAACPRSVLADGLEGLLRAYRNFQDNETQ
jgi:cystathionine beta-lyase